MTFNKWMLMLSLRNRFRLTSILTRDLKILGLSLAIRQLVMGYVQVVRTLYLYVVGFDVVSIGLLLTLTTVVGAARSGVIGVLADRYGRKIFLILGGAFSAIRFLIYTFSTDFIALALAQGIGAFGEGAGAGQPAVTGIISDKSTIENRTKVFSTLAFTNAIAATTGSLLAVAPPTLQGWLGLEQIFSYQLLFLSNAVLSIVSAVLIIPIKEEREEKEAFRRRSFLPKKSWATISKFSLVRAIGGFGFGMTEPLLPLWFKIRFDVGEEILGPVYATSRFLAMCSYLVVTKFASIVGEIRSIVITRLISSATIITMSFLPTYSLASIFLIIFRISLLFSMPIRQSFITYIVDPSERSSAVGISNLSRMAMRSFAPTTSGYIMQEISSSLPFFIGSGIVALNGGLYYLFFHKTDKREKNRSPDHAKK